MLGDGHLICNKPLPDVAKCSLAQFGVAECDNVSYLTHYHFLVLLNCLSTTELLQTTPENISCLSLCV